MSNAELARRLDLNPSTVHGIIRTLGSTGGVITAAGLIFAASMAGSSSYTRRKSLFRISR